MNIQVQRSTTELSRRLSHKVALFNIINLLRDHTLLLGLSSETCEAIT
jgi:hypothetical protein